MRIFKRGVGQAAPLAKNVSVTELLLRGAAARTAMDSETRKAVPGQRKEVLEELSAAAKEAQQGLRGSRL